MFNCPLLKDNINIKVEYSRLATVSQNNQVIFQYMHKTVPFFLLCLCLLLHYLSFLLLPESPFHIFFILISNT